MNSETKKGLKIGFSLVGVIMTCALVDTFADKWTSLLFFGTLLTLISVVVIKKYK